MRSAKFVVGLGALVVSVLALPTSSEAYTLRVTYVDAGRAPALSLNVVVRTIQAVMREYEATSRGQVVFEWGGLVSSRQLGTGNISISWDSTLTGACANSQGSWWLPTINGDVRVNPNFITNMVGFLNGCGGLRPALVHELAHIFQQNPNHDPRDSVLGWSSPGYRNSWLGGAGQSRPIAHPWNIDMDSYPCGVPFQLSFCPEHVSYQIEDYNASTLASSSLAAFDEHNGYSGSALPLEGFFTAGLGMGSGTGGTNSYAIVDSRGNYDYPYTTSTIIDILQGSGSSYAVTSSIHNAGSRFRMCVTSSTDMQHMLVAWADQNEMYIPGYVFDPNSSYDQMWGNVIGGRNVLYSRSSDGGITFSAPAAVPGSWTRAGVSCTWNPARNTYLVGWQGAGPDDQIWVGEADGAGPGSWIVLPVAANGYFTPTTLDMPRLYFDPFGGSTSHGVAIWQHSGDMVAYEASLQYNSTYNGYVLGAAPVALDCNTASCDLTYRRGDYIGSILDGTQFHWAFGSSITAGSQTRHRRHNAPPSFTDASDSWPTPCSGCNLDHYVDFAEHRNLYQRAYLTYRVEQP